QLLWVLVGIVTTYTLVKLVDLFAAYLEPKVKATESKLDDQLLPIIRKTLKIFIVAIGAMAIMEGLDLPVTSFLAGLGIGGLAFALATKETLANIFGSIAIFADKPFRVGERIIVDGCDGPVESIGLRSTRIRTLDGTLVTIPNARMAEATINNISKRPTIKNLYTIGITYDTGYDKMKKALEILRDIFKNHPSTENYWVYFKEFGAHSLNILVIH
ncbi:mechanosensitive ion channel family protein, partial [candidate division NPL-UPA2 bacterium]|nr:mechanosensitive ion channel family protein [candidate division NPL-UPA2 bacterium]